MCSLPYSNWMPLKPCASGPPSRCSCVLSKTHNKSKRSQQRSWGPERSTKKTKVSQWLYQLSPAHHLLSPPPVWEKISTSDIAFNFPWNLSRLNMWTKRAQNITSTHHLYAMYMLSKLSSVTSSWETELLLRSSADVYISWFWRSSCLSVTRAHVMAWAIPAITVTVPVW